MWHLSFAAANLVLSVATAVAFSSKLSRGWVEGRRSSAGASADEEVGVRAPPWAKGHRWFALTPGRAVCHLCGPGPCACLLWMGALSGWALAALLASAGVFFVLLVCPWHFVPLGQQAPPCQLSQWLKENICPRKRKKSSLVSADDWIWSLSVWSLTPEVRPGGFQIWSDGKYRLVTAEPEVTGTHFQKESCNSLTEFVHMSRFWVSVWTAWG